MGKLLFWAVIIIGLLLVARLLARSQAARQQTPQQPASVANRPGKGTPEAMVRCAHCGIHMPRSEAVLVQGQTWCSEEHARLGVRP